VFSIRQINNLTFIWTTAALISALMLTSYGIIQNRWINMFLITLTLAGVFIFRRLINNEKSDSIKKFFVLLNSYYLILMILMILDGILQGPQANGI
jgi:4-hydroxybenzoate polyprenyltransferase